MWHPCTINNISETGPTNTCFALVQLSASPLIYECEIVVLTYTEIKIFEWIHGSLLESINDFQRLLGKVWYVCFIYITVLHIFSLVL